MYNIKIDIKLMIVSTKVVSKHDAIRFKQNITKKFFFSFFVHVNLYFTVVEV